MSPSPVQKVPIDIDRSRSATMRTLVEKLRKVARTDSSLLLLGETGVGKTTLAELVHAESARRAAPFVSVNGALWNDDLAESKIFGADPGSFTGCRMRLVGALEQAHNGTLFIDEVTELTLKTQGLLLRALDDKGAAALGGRTYQADFRIICATNEALDEAVRQGRFRNDLFYRIAHFVLRVPPLRERREDLRDNISVCLQKLRVESPLDEVLTSDALAWLEAHPLQGNFRELESLLNRALVYGDGRRIDMRDLRAAETEGEQRGVAPMRTMPSPPNRASLRKLAASDLEDLYIRKDAGEHESALMSRYGISRATLYRYLKQRPKL